MSWRDHVTFDEFKLLYKGVDIDVSSEFIQDLNANNVFVTDDVLEKEFDKMYNSKIEVIRDKKLDIILGLDKDQLDDTYNL